MNKRDSKKSKKIRKLIVFCSLTSFIFIVATYAWFIGMRSVNVSSFEIEIASTDSLLLSLDGSKWDTTVTINSENFNDTTNTVYAGNVNNWAGIGTSVLQKGLKPISSVGEIDADTSTMKMFEKGSLTATKGGYRLMASRVPNAAVGSNPDGYVVFDLFIKNSSGTEYYPTYNELNEEAIYLTTDSKVKVGSTGVADAGIENSVRVAFAQIGRVKAPTTAETQATPTVTGDPSVATVQGITCTTGGDVTGICRTATIWEPNDTDHVANALTWYNTTCTQRSGADTSLAASYGAAGTCSTVVNGQAYHTYAIAKEVRVENGVDVYDGADYNKYTADVTTTYADAIDTTTTTTEVGGQQVTTNNGKYLYQVPYFTDTMKLQRGTARPQFMSLAPNSVTKVRVYIYLEGQDIDNYDFASIGKQISVNFGFTKERFTEDDINYNGPDLNQGNGPIVGDTAAERRANIISAANLGENPTNEQIIAAIKAVDHTAPVIHFADGTNQNMTVEKDGTFTAPTVSSVTDNVTTFDLTGHPEVVRQSGVVNTAVPGTYRILYEVEDEAGNLATEVVAVTVTPGA